MNKPTCFVDPQKTEIYREERNGSASSKMSERENRRKVLTDDSKHCFRSGRERVPKMAQLVITSEGSCQGGGVMTDGAAGGDRTLPLWWGREGRSLPACLPGGVRSTGALFTTPLPKQNRHVGIGEQT